MRISPLAIRSWLLTLSLLAGFPALLPAQYNTVGDAFSTGTDCFTLTPAANSQGGGVWSTNSLDPNQPFDIRASVALGSNDSGADGIAFVLQTTGTNAIGSTALGGSLGYGGLTPSVIVEFDTYQNSTLGDPAFDHLAMLSNGSNSHTAATSLVAPVGILPGNANAEDGTFHDVRFHWQPSLLTLDVYVDCQLRLTYNGDLRLLLNNSSTVTYGFTGATGGLNNLQQVCFDPNPSTNGGRTDLSICQGDTVTLTAGTGTSYAWSPAAGLSATTLPSVQAYPTATTTYLASYLDDCGLTVTDTFAITVNPNTPISVNLGPDFTLCPVEDSLLDPGLPTSYQYLWQDGSTNPTLTATGPGTYFVEVRDGCRLGRDTVLVGPTTLDLPTFTLADSLCPGEITTVLLTNPTLPATDYTWDFDGGTVVSGGGTLPQQVNWSTPGVKTVCLTVSRGGCSRSYCENVVIKAPPQVFINPVADQCLPGNSFNFTVAGSNADVYQWDFGASASPATFQGANPPAVSYLSPGPKTVRLVTFGSGCQADDTATVSFNVVTPPTANFSVTNPSLCQNELVSFSYTGTSQGPGQTYAWNFGPGAVPQTSTQANPGQVRYTSSGPKTVTLTVGFGPCAVSATQTLTVAPTPSVNAGLDQSFCEGDGGVQLDATVSGGSGVYFYNWNCDLGGSCGFSATTVEDPTVNPNNTNPSGEVTYYLQVTDFNGCVSNVDSVVVQVKAKPRLDAGPDLSICEAPGPGINLQGSIAANNQAPQPITYQWVPSSGITGPLTTLTPFARPDTTTIYTLIGTSINGCSSDATTVDPVSTMTLRVRPNPEANAGPDTGLCIGDSVRLNGTATGAGPNYTYTWTASPAGSLDDPSGPNPVARPTQTTIYTLVVSSGGCVSNGDNVRVQVDTRPTLTPGNGGDVCLFQPYQLNANAAGDPNGSTYTYQWTPATGLDDPTSATPIATPPQTTTYRVTAVSAFGCVSDTPAVTVTLKPTPEVELLAADTTLCSDDTLLLEAQHRFRGGVSAPVSYQWIPADFVVSQPSDSQVAISPRFSRPIIVEARSATCATRDTMFVQVEFTIEAALSADTTRFCAGGSTQLRATGGSGAASFTWSPATGLSDPNRPNPVAAPTETTTYTVRIEEGVCEAEESVTIEVNPVPEADFFSSLPNGCENLEISFIENAGPDAAGYIWRFGDGSPVSNEPNPSHFYDAPGEYVVNFTAIGPGGCAVDTQATVVVSAGPEVDIVGLPDPGEPVPSDFDVLLRAEGEGLTGYLWTFSDGGTANGPEVRYQFDEPGTYLVELTVTSEDGCTRTFTYGPYEVFPGDLQLQNIFTPNGDGANDEFRLRYFGDGDYEVMVYDRWGRLVFVSTNPGQGWDGTYQGAPAPTGVYFYTAVIEGRSYEASLTLLR